MIDELTEMHRVDMFIEKFNYPKITDPRDAFNPSSYIEDVLKEHSIDKTDEVLATLYEERDRDVIDGGEHDSDEEHDDESMDFDEEINHA